LVEFIDGGAGQSYSFEYDLCDRVLVESSSDDIAIRRYYDNLGNIVREVFPGDLFLDYCYDDGNRVTEVNLPNNGKIQYEYEGPYLSKVFRYSLGGGLLYEHTYSKTDFLGQTLESILPGSGCIVSYDWDLLGRNVGITAPYFKQTLDEFDPVGDLLSQTVVDSGGTFVFGYCYDDLSQLIEESGLFDHTYAFDSISNRVDKDGTECDVDDLNRLVEQADISCSYDLNGNLIELLFDGGGVNFNYDVQNRLTSCFKDGERWLYRYDFGGRRLGKTYQILSKSGVWNDIEGEQYLYHADREVASLQEGEYKELRVLGRSMGADLGAAISIEKLGVVYVPIHDHRGNLVALLDFEGNSIENYHYSAFGEGDFEVEEAISPWLFSSKRYDEESAWYYFGKRYYVPDLGVFSSADPEGFVDGANLYAYVSANPLVLVDPYGLSAQMPIIGICPGLQDATKSNFNKGLVCGGADAMLDPIGIAWRYSGYLGAGLSGLCNGDASYYKYHYNNMSSDDKSFFAGQIIGEVATIVVASVYAAGKTAVQEGGMALVGRSAMLKADAYLNVLARRGFARVNKLFSRMVQKEGQLAFASASEGGIGAVSRNIVKHSSSNIAMCEGVKNVGRVAGGVLDVIKPGGKYIGSAGSSKRIRILQGGAREAEQMFAKLSKGGTIMKDNGAHKLVKMPDGNFVGYRPVSTSGPPTVDVHFIGKRKMELKYLE
jgi:RHS repeat-associated protein